MYSNIAEGTTAKAQGTTAKAQGTTAIAVVAVGSRPDLRFIQNAQQFGLLNTKIKTFFK